LTDLGFKIKGEVGSPLIAAILLLAMLAKTLLAAALLASTNLLVVLHCRERDDGCCQHRLP